MNPGFNLAGAIFNQAMPIAAAFPRDAELKDDINSGGGIGSKCFRHLFEDGGHTALPFWLCFFYIIGRR